MQIIQFLSIVLKYPVYFDNIFKTNALYKNFKVKCLSITYKEILQISNEFMLDFKSIIEPDDTSQEELYTFIG